MANAGQSRATGPLFFLKTGCPNRVLVVSGLQKISGDFNFGQKKGPKIRQSEIFTAQ